MIKSIILREINTKKLLVLIRIKLNRKRIRMLAGQAQIKRLVQKLKEKTQVLRSKAFINLLTHQMLYQIRRVINN